MLQHRPRIDVSWQEARPIGSSPGEPYPVLSPRERLVLKAIVHCYTRHAEPVGSRALCRFYRMDLSPATIRNVMMDLEEKGLIGQPHTSAGRVPTDRGYRVYVDMIMRPEGLSSHETIHIDETIDSTPPEAEAILEWASNVLSARSAQLGLAYLTAPGRDLIARIDFVRLDSAHWLLLVRGASGNARTATFTADADTPAPAWEQAHRFLNGQLAGQVWNETARGAVLDRLTQAGIGDNPVLRAALAALDRLEGPDGFVHVHFGGTGNIMAQPEFRRSEDLRGLFEALERRQPLRQIFGSGETIEPGRVHVMIGTENPFEGLRSMSVVFSTYGAGDGQGHVAIIGPTRMPYSRLVSLVFYIAATMDARLRDLE